MGIGDSLGNLAKKWARSKATELLSADKQKSEAAAQQADAAQQQAKADTSEQVVRTMFPKLAAYSDAQDERKREAEETAAREERAEIAGLPVATVRLSTTGWAAGQWEGQLPLRWEVVQPDAASEPDPTDPYAARPALYVELATLEDQRPSLGGHDLVRWAFQVPAYAGDGSYDLVTIAREREAAGATLTYEEWELAFADGEDSAFYFYSEAGASTVTIAQGGKRLSVTIAMSGAIGDQTATAEITRSG